MLAAVPVVRQLLPGLLRGEYPSVACVYTTRPKDPSSTYRRISRPASSSSARPDAWPRSKRCWRSSARGCRGRCRRRSLRPLERGHERARAAGAARHTVVPPVGPGQHPRRMDGAAGPREPRAGSFHAAVREVPAWVGLVIPALELRRQAMLSRFRGVPLSEARARARGRMEHRRRSRRRAARLLPARGFLAQQPAGVAGLHRHHRLRRIRTDPRAAARRASAWRSRCACRRGTAASSPRASASRSASRRRAPMKRCRADAMPALLMHHLLWRVNQCDGLERREPLRRALLRWAEELAATPDSFMGVLS